MPVVLIVAYACRDSTFRYSSIPQKSELQQRTASVTHSSFQENQALPTAPTGRLTLSPHLKTFEKEGVVKAQNSRAVVFAPRSCQSRAEDRSSETNQLSANRSITLTNLEFGAESRVLQKSRKVSNRPEM